ncbi:helix-turn-helix transcriptional regulator [Kribbella sp. NPDC051620]|uniref:helix-turn-helix transcriptional regulator n=1 Tax=Kribbella sp. NPDC051620 TaxID=3364120 RepID=UPI0037AEA44A
MERQLTTVPLRSADPLQSRRIDDLRDAVQRLTVVHDVAVRVGQANGLVTTARLGGLDLVYVRYGTRVVVDAFPTAHRFALTVPLGPMGVALDDLRGAETRRAGFVLSQERHTLMDPDPADGALVISASMAHVEQHLIGMTGRTLSRPLRFLAPPASPGAAPAELLDSAWQLVCRTLGASGGERPGVLVARALEDTLLSAVLLALPHTATGDLLAEEERVGWTYADRARQWLEAHHEEPVSVTDVARAVGIGVRQLQHLFAEHFGATPTEVLREIRLCHAHSLLSGHAGGSMPTVAAVAHRCGFAHLGRFSIAYRDRFGESPSETARRVRG